VPTHAKNKVVLVTDSTSKFGRHLALEYAKLNAKLFLVGTDEESLHNVTFECLKEGAQDVEVVLGDVFDVNVRQKLVPHVEAKYGQLDYLVLNHDFRKESVSSAWNDTKERNRVMDENLISSVELVSAALPLLQRRRGYIGHVSKMPGRVSVPYLSYEAASKAALQGYLMSLRQELKRKEDLVSVTSVTLAYIDEVEGEADEGRWGNWFRHYGEIKIENAAWWAMYHIGGRKKQVSFPFAAQCHAALYSWFPSIYENPESATLKLSLPFASS